MSEVREAVVVLCKCGEVHRTFGIRTEKRNNEWYFTWAFPIKEASAKREGYDQTKVVGQILLEKEYPGCPYCKNKGFVVCSCGHICCNITKDGIFTCEWCGSSGALEDYDGAGIKAGMDL